MKSPLPLSLALLTVLSAGFAQAQPQSAGDDRIVTTSHATRIDGVEIRYTATTGTLVQRHPNGKPRGHFFFVAYTREGQDVSTRPITFSNRYLNLVDELRQAMARNPFLKVLVTNGYFDMATPFAATEHTFAHLGYEDTFKDRVKLTYYEGRHMMYTHPDLLQKLKKDIAEFVNGAKSSKR